MTKTDDTGWSALGSGADNSVSALAVAGGKLYVGAAAFLTAGGKSSPYAAYVNLPVSACGDGIALPLTPTPLCQQVALPYVPAATTASVHNVLGTGATGRLDPADYDSGTANYNAGQSWWRLFRRDNTANRNVLMRLRQRPHECQRRLLAQEPRPAGRRR